MAGQLKLSKEVPVESRHLFILGALSVNTVPGDKRKHVARRGGVRGIVNNAPKVAATKAALRFYCSCLTSKAS